MGWKLKSNNLSFEYFFLIPFFLLDEKETIPIAIGTRQNDPDSYRDNPL
jgi:hypothetical protein